MKKLILPVVLHLAGSVAALAIAYTFNSGFDNGGGILDGNVNPWSDTRALSGTAGQSITDVSVRLSLSGGYNGDLYGYLSFNGLLVPLLNRVGVGSGDPFGYDDAGLNVTFTDGAAANIHFYQAVGGYSIAGGAAWQPDGRMINPVTSLPAAFDAAGTTSLGAFSGMGADGDWTLVLADLSAGGGQSTVVSWGLDITTTNSAVPETGAWLTNAVFLLAVGGMGWWQRRRRLSHG
jgi:hypothetical protein